MSARLAVRPRPWCWLLAALPTLLTGAQAADAACGRIADAQGLTARRLAGEARWRAASEGQALEPGELVKTGVRGANALRLTLGNGGSLVLGPGAQVELTGPGGLRLLAGEVLIAPAGQPVAAISVTGPTANGQAAPAKQVSARTVLQVEKGQLTTLPQDPRWLSGYEADQTQGGLGSLLAQVDGREVPLTIGYHQVRVDVRDQLARTVIEESFQNHTGSVLEGVFYFPLPADASISGFSMWIGDQQVHGEVVEKERARAIYEQILREKRDPGLLEWAGGSLFKARVYPIGAEKRIRISYTQVLPRVLGADGSATWVYRHALDSEALRQHPLERLGIEVTVSSTRALGEVTCATHACQIERGEHAARVTHQAEEVRGTRDFELRIATAPPAQSGAGGLTCVTHRRADDGYLLLLIDTPSAPAEQAQAAARRPLDLLLLVDTSGSIDPTARAAQERFVAGLLESLGEADRFNLVTCDVEARPAFQRAQAPAPGTIEAALGTLAAREPLGWTDLDLALARARELAGPETRVVYVGDGAVTTGDADPAAFAQRANEAWKGAGLHVVVPGSQSEPLALDGLTRLGSGGGTLRGLAGTEPSQAAFELLRDLSAPLVRGVEVRVEGVATAAVYPDQLRALPAGSQQVVAARFDPRGAQRGAILVAGKLGDVPWRLTGELRVPPPSDDPDAASFVPRLWARLHLDHLLAQGTGQTVRERVIALSEDYQILTPYTSFLVLESDADRARFQVQKRLRMRDGEEFFRAGQQAAGQELLQAELTRARRWRRAERQRALASLEDLARGLTLTLQGGALPSGSIALGLAEDESSFTRSLDGAGAPAAGGEALDDLKKDADGADQGEPAPEESADERDSSKEEEAPETPAAEPAPAKQAAPVMMERAEGKVRQSANYAGRMRRGGRGVPARPQPALLPAGVPGTPWTWLDQVAVGPGGPFPAVGAAPEHWPADVRALVARLDRARAIAAQAGGAGLRVTVSAERQDREGTLTPAGTRTWLLGGDRWATEDAGLPGQEVRLEWVLPAANGQPGASGQRGALTLSWLLGQRRELRAGDERAWPSPCAWFRSEELFAYAGWSAALQGNELTLTAGAQRLVLEIDLEQGRIVGARQEGPDGLIERVRFEEPFQAGGVVWPGLITREDGAGKVLSREHLRAEPLAGDAFQVALEQLLAPRAQALLIGPRPTPRAARAALTAGQDSLEVRAALLGWLGNQQRWEEAWPHLDAFERLAGARAGLIPLRAHAWLQGRRLESLRDLLRAEAARLAGAPRTADLAAARQLWGWSGALESPAERLELLGQLRGIAARRERVAEAALEWAIEEAGLLAAAGQPERALSAWRALVAAHPLREDLAAQLGQALAQSGEPEQAAGALREAAARLRAAGRAEQAGQLEVQGVHHLWNGERWNEVLSEAERLEREGSSGAGEATALRLEALLLLDREEEAWTWAQAAVNGLGADATGPLEPAQLWRAQAAAQFALGRTTWRGRQRLDARAEALLVTLARALLARGPAAEPALAPLRSWQFLQGNAARQLGAELRARAAEQARGLGAAPAAAALQQLAWLVSWARTCESGGPAPESEWAPLVEAIEALWRAARAKLSASDRPSDELAQAAAALEGILGQELAGAEVALRWRRARLELSRPGAERRAAAADLLGALTRAGWTSAQEDEAWGLLGQLGPAEGEADELRELALDGQALALTALVDWSREGRPAAKLTGPEANALGRRALKAARQEAQRDALLALRDRVAGLTLPGLEEWVRVEGAWLAVQAVAAGADAALLTAARTEAGAVLERGLSQLAPADSAPTRRAQVVLARALSTELWLLAGDPQRAARAAALLARLEQARAANDPRLDWTEAQWLLLQVVELPGELLTRVEAWSQDPLRGPDWARRRAWLLLDADRLDDAAAQLWALVDGDEVQGEDLARLAALETARGKPDQAERARARGWAVRPEWEISNWLWQECQRVSRQGEGIPEPLDPQVPLAVGALLGRAQSPSQYQWVIQRLYETTREPAVLLALAEAVPGHSPGRLYDLLGCLGPLLQTVQEEATIDAALSRSRALLGETRTPWDRRGLQLLVFLFSRAAAAQKQGSAPHAARAIEALQAAFPAPGEENQAWAPGEARRYAELLASWPPDFLADPAVEAELLRQLRALLAGSAPGSDERVALALALGRALRAHNQAEEAARELGVALNAVAAADGGALPQRHWEAARELTGWLAALGEWKPAEALLETQLRLAGERGHSARALDPLLRALHSLRRDALAAGQALRQGGGAALLTAELALLRAELADGRARDEQATAATQDLCSLLEVAYRIDKLRAQAASEAQTLARTDLPRLLAARQHRPAQQVLGRVSEVVAALRSPADGLEVLVAAAETQPTALRRRRADVWSQEDWRIAELRERASAALPQPLAERLLRAACAELRQRLDEGEDAPALCRVDHYRGWKEQVEAWARVAHEALVAGHELPAERQEETVVHVASYLEHQLERREAALAALRDARRRGVLGPIGLDALAGVLERSAEWAEAVPILEALVAGNGADLDLRLRLLVATHNAGDPARRDAVLQAIDSWLTEGKRRQEYALVSLGEACLGVSLPARAEPLLREALALHSRAAGGADGQLSRILIALARACAGQGQTAEAVEAASGAVVAWGRGRYERQQALAVLEEVLAGASDLASYVGTVEAEEQQTGQINATLHRVLARVLRRQGALAEAERHLTRALEVAPDDAEALGLRVELLDARGQREEASRAQLALARHLGHDVAAWRGLAQRWQQLGRPAEAERAFTQLCEYSPHESEGHQALAEVRGQQGRWAESIVQWRQVTRIRTQEAAGWLGLLSALIEGQSWEEAAAVAERLRTSPWPDRAQVQAQLAPLEARLRARGGR